MVTETGAMLSWIVFRSVGSLSLGVFDADSIAMVFGLVNLLRFGKIGLMSLMMYWFVNMLEKSFIVSLQFVYLSNRLIRSSGTKSGWSNDF